MSRSGEYDMEYGFIPDDDTEEILMTNGDYIRQMSDEELAKIIVRTEYFDKFCEIVLAGENPGFCDDDCNECALDWLKQEAKDDDKK